MRRELIELVERKLQTALHEVDARALERGREAWKEIGPAPNCPAVAEVMKVIHTAIADGLNKRSQACFEVTLETVSPFKGNLTREIADDIMKVVQKLFPKEIFLPMARQTEGVYKRAQAPSQKFSQRVFENDIALIAVTEANSTRRAIIRVKTGLDELLLQEESKRPSRWKRTLLGFFNFFALPLVRWGLALIGAVVTAFVLHALGLGGA